MRPAAVVALTACVLVAFSAAADDTETDAQSDDEKSAQGFSKRTSKTGYTDELPPFGGRNSPAGEIVESDTELEPAFRFPKIDAAMQPWNDWKTKTDNDHSVALSAHYSTLYQQLSNAIPGSDNKASGGVLRGTLKWTPIGKDTA